MRGTLLAFAIIFCGASCGSGSGTGQDADDAPDVEDDVTADTAADTGDADDTREEPDLSGDPEPDGESCTETLGPLDAWEEECYFISEGWDYLATVEGTIASVPYSYIVIELWPTEGGPSTPGTYAFTDANYDACGLCSVVRLDCEADCARQFLLTGGTIEVDEVGAIGEQFSGRIVSARGIEVEIDLSTYHSTPVPDGDTICIEELTFSTEVLEY